MFHVPKGRSESFQRPFFFHDFLVDSSDSWLVDASAQSEIKNAKLNFRVSLKRPRGTTSSWFKCFPALLWADNETSSFQREIKTDLRCFDWNSVHPAFSFGQNTRRRVQGGSGRRSWYHLCFSQQCICELEDDDPRSLNLSVGRDWHRLLVRQQFSWHNGLQLDVQINLIRQRKPNVCANRFPFFTEWNLICLPAVKHSNVSALISEVKGHSQGSSLQNVNVKNRPALSGWSERVSQMGDTPGVRGRGC